jgi:hypothetical protein
MKPVDASGLSNSRSSSYKLISTSVTTITEMYSLRNIINDLVLWLDYELHDQGIGVLFPESAGVFVVSKAAELLNGLTASYIIGDGGLIPSVCVCV